MRRFRAVVSSAHRDAERVEHLAHVVRMHTGPVDYLSAIGMTQIAAHEQAITAYALDRLKAVDGIRILGPEVPTERGGAISFRAGPRNPGAAVFSFQQIEAVSCGCCRCRSGLAVS
ncbi:MAG: hypothetical protein DLM62_13580 [Pseudonocardiales bacterium]|nr:MAG: hypothetical protein DLM62_13580 [Pseudonocardiales bacterium]